MGVPIGRSLFVLRPTKKQFLDKIIGDAVRCTAMNNALAFGMVGKGLVSGDGELLDACAWGVELPTRDGSVALDETAACLWAPVGSSCVYSGSPKSVMSP